MFIKICRNYNPAIKRGNRKSWIFSIVKWRFNRKSFINEDFVHCLITGGYIFHLSTTDFQDKLHQKQLYPYSQISSPKYTVLIFLPVPKTKTSSTCSIYHGHFGDFPCLMTHWEGRSHYLKNIQHGTQPLLYVHYYT